MRCGRLSGECGRVGKLRERERLVPGGFPRKGYVIVIIEPKATSNSLIWEGPLHLLYGLGIWFESRIVALTVGVS